MRKLNFLRKSERKSVGTTLALTVGSPSAHRRYSALKHLAFMLLFLLGSLNVWGGDVIVTLDNIGTSLTSTANTTALTTDIIATGTEDEYTLNYYQCKKQGSAMFMTKNVNPYISNKTPMPGNIKSVQVFINTGAAKATTYNCAFSATECNAANAATGVGAVNITGGNSNTFEANVEGKYFLITLGNANNGQVLKLVITCEGSSSPEPTVSLDHIAITGTPSKTYEQGQSFDPTGLTVTAYYDDDTDANVTGDVEWSFNPATFTVAGENKSVTATATYEGKEDSKTYNDITVTEHVVTAGTYDITFNNAFFGTTGLTGSLSGTNLKDYSGSKDDITVEYKKGTGSNMYLKDSEIRLYSGNTLVITAPSGYNITSVTGLKSSMTANEGTITDTEWSGESNSVTFSHNDTKGNSSLATISVTYAAVDMSKPVTPTFSVAAGVYTEAQSVEINCVTDGATIYYTTDGSTPDNTSTEYTGSAISLSERGTYTIKAIAIKGEDASAVASATYTINLPYIFASVSELFTYLDENSLTTLNDVTVTGYVSEIVTEYSTQYSNISFNISDDGSTTAAQLQSYRGKGTDASSIEVGDKVTISGNYKVHNSTKELDQNNTITNRIAKGSVTSVAVSGTATKTTYSANETFETAGLEVTATYANGFSEVVTEGITWGDDLTDHKVAATGTVHVTATVGGKTSDAYDVAIEVSTKELLSIALSADEFEVYQGLELPKPTVTATYSEGEPEDVTALAEFTGYNKNTPGEQTITVSYSFGTGDPIEETYTVTVKPIYNVELAASVARDLIINSVGSAGSGANEMIIRGIVVNPSNPSNSKQTYYISDDGSNTNTVEIFKGLYIDGANFTANNKLIAGDEVVVKGAVTYYQSSTPEFSEGSILQSLARTPNFEIEAVTGFEVGSANLAVADLTITQDGEGAVTLASSNNTDAVTIVDGKLHAVAPGTATITANLDADGIYKAKTATFDVTVIAAQVKYAITFDGNGADGGEAPEAIANKAAGAEVTLPANSYTKTGYTFSGWKVFYVDGESVEHEVTISENAFTMPAFAVTIQAQWAEIPEWAVKYTSNVTLTAGTGAQAAKVRFTADGEQYDAVKAGTGKAGGSITVTVPAQATKLHLHVAGWTGENPTISITAPEGVTVTPASISATEDEGMNSNSPFTLKNDPVDQYLVLSLSGNTEEIQLTFSTDAGNKRFALYGVNQEGGVLPVLDHIEIAGDLNTKSGYKAGDDLDLDGLTVSATYTLGGTPQTPVDITEDVALEWSYDPLVVDQTSVTITATYKGQTDDITITGLDPVASADPKIYVSTLNVNFASVEVSESVPAAETVTVTLTNVASVTATLGGTNADAFSVSPASLTESGDITISILANTDAAASYAATLTISDGEGGADDKTVNLSFEVTEPVVEDDVTGTWTLVSNATTLAAGKKVIIAQYVEADGAINTMAGQASNNRSVIASTVAGATLTPTVGTKVMTLADAGEGHFYLKTSDGEYLYNASGTKSYLKTKATSDDASWTIEVDADGVATITAVENTTRPIMRYNPNTSGSPLFNCYASGQEDIALYMLEEDTPEPPTPTYTEVRNGLNAGEFYTMCLNKAVTDVRGGSIWRVLSKAENGTDVILEEVEGTLDAGRPYIFYATAAQLEVVYEGAAVGAPITTGNNGLVGSFTKELIAQSPNNFIIYNNALYYVNSDKVYVGEHRAYLNMEAVPPYSNEPQQGNAPRRRVTMAVYGEQVATGIESIQPSEISNQKVLINGQLFILRGEKMYDATGRLVK